jgi:hypothetical protein
MVPFQNMTASFFNTAIDNMRTIEFQTADSIRNNTVVFLESTDLKVPMAEDSTYVFEGYFFYDTTAAADIIIQLRAPVGTAMLIAQWGSGSAISTATNSINVGAVSNTSSLNLVYGGVSAGTVLSVNPRGSIVTVGSSGYFSIAHAQNVATAGNTLLKQGSYFTLARIE